MSRKNPDKPKAERPPTLKQEIFVEKLFELNGNGVRAAEAAGYKGDVNTLNQVARANLQNPTIQALRRKRLEGLRASNDEILFVLADQMRGDLADLRECADSEGRLDFAEAKKRGVSHLVKKYKTNTRNIRKKDGESERIITTEIELYSAQEAAKTLADIAGLKQAPRENDVDVERRERAKEKAKQCFEYLLGRCGGDEEAALVVMTDKYPNLKGYLELD